MHEELAVNFNARHQKTANQGDYHRNKTSRDHQVAIARISRFLPPTPPQAPRRFPFSVFRIWKFLLFQFALFDGLMVLKLPHFEKGVTHESRPHSIDLPERFGERGTTKTWSTPSRPAKCHCFGVFEEAVLFAFSLCAGYTTYHKTRLGEFLVADPATFGTACPRADKQWHKFKNPISHR